MTGVQTCALPIYAEKLVLDNKVFIRGRVSVEEEKNGKLICEEITAFDEIPRTLWVRFPSMEAYEKAQERLFSMLKECDGKDGVTIFIEQPRAMKKLPANMGVQADGIFVQELAAVFGPENIKVVS